MVVFIPVPFKINYERFGGQNKRIELEKVSFWETDIETKPDKVDFVIGFDFPVPCKINYERFGGQNKRIELEKVSFWETDIETKPDKVDFVIGFGFDVDVPKR